MSRCAVAFRTAAVLTLFGVQGVFGGETYISIVPVGTGPRGELEPGVVIDGNTITLTTDGTNPVPVFLEFRIGDWDPADTGVKLRGYQIHFDSSSFATGSSGALTYNLGSTPCGECSDNAEPCFGVEECTAGTCSGSGGPCHIAWFDCPLGETCLGAASCDAIVSADRACSDNGDPCASAEDCTPGACLVSGLPCHGTEREGDCGPGDACFGAALCDGGGVCEAELGAEFSCGAGVYQSGTRGGSCNFVAIDVERSDYVFSDILSALPVLDLGTSDVRLGGTLLLGPPDDPEPFPVAGLYAGSMALLVSPDAQGTFTISVFPEPSTNLLDPQVEFITSLELIPAQIRVNPGRCYFNLDLTPFGRDRCVDGLTQNECAAQNGVTFFEAGGTCADLRPAVCGDNLMNHFSEECDGTDDAACAGICLGDCTCNPTCGDVDGDGNADMLGMAILMNCFTGPDAGPVAPECQCAKFDTDDDIDLDDLFGFYHILNGP